MMIVANAKNPRSRPITRSAYAASCTSPLLLNAFPIVPSPLCVLRTIGRPSALQASALKASGID